MKEAATELTRGFTLQVPPCEKSTVFSPNLARVERHHCQTGTGGYLDDNDEPSFS